MKSTFYFAILLIILVFLSNNNLYSNEKFELSPQFQERLLEKVPDDTRSIIHYYLTNENTIVQERKYILQAIKENINDDDFIDAMAYHLCGVYFFGIKYYKTTYEYFVNANRILKKINYPLYTFDNFSFLGIIDYELGNYQESINNHLSAQKYLTKIQPYYLRLDRTAVNNWNLGRAYTALNKFDKARLHLDSAALLVKKLKDKDFFYKVYWIYELPNFYKAELYSKMNKIDSAIICYQDALLYANKNMSDNFIYTKMRFFNQIKLWDSTINMINDYPKLDLNKKHSDTTNIFVWTLWEFLAEAFFVKGDYKNAYRYLEAYNNYQKKSMVDNNTGKLIGQNVLMENKMRAEAEKQKLATILLIVLIIAVLIIVLIYFYRFRQIKKINKQLDEQNQTKDKLFRVISHDLRGPILNNYAVFDMILNHYSQMDDTKKIEYLQLAKNSMNKVAMMLESLLDWAKSKMNTKTGETENVIIKAEIEKVLEQLGNTIKSKNLQVKVNFTANPQVRLYLGDFQVIFRNLLTNAIKYSYINGEIHINLKQKNKKYLVEVVDFGIGMDPKIMANLFTYDKTKIRPGVSGERGVGLGLVNANELANRNKINLRFEQNKPQGTIAIIEIRR